MAATEKYVVDGKGERIGVLLDLDDYRKILGVLEEPGSIRAYDKAKASGDEAIPFEKAIEEIDDKTRVVTVLHVGHRRGCI